MLEKATQNSNMPRREAKRTERTYLGNADEVYTDKNSTSRSTYGHGHYSDNAPSGDRSEITAARW